MEQRKIRIIEMKRFKRDSVDDAAHSWNIANRLMRELDKGSLIKVEFVKQNIVASSN